MRGIWAFLFGLIALFLPLITLSILILMVGVYLLADGLYSLVSLIRIRDPGYRRLLLEGSAGVLLGTLILVCPDVTIRVILTLVAFWAIVTGIMRAVVAIRVPRGISGKWLLVLSAAISTLLGVFVLLFPTLGRLVIVRLIGAFALAIGSLLILFGLRWGR
jgi:uncharacterized membrane protein HdeD (DUF308 family)